MQKGPKVFIRESIKLQNHVISMTSLCKGEKVAEVS